MVDTKIGAPIFGTNEDGDIIITDNEVNTIIADQSSVISGIFSQYEIKINKLKIAARITSYNVCYTKLLRMFSVSAGFPPGSASGRGN